MKINALIRLVSLGCILSVGLTANRLMAIENAAEMAKDYLPVRESLLPMFSVAFRMNEWFPIHRVNPGVRPYIHFYLQNDNSSYDYVAGGIWLLGVIGTEEDIAFVDRYIQSHLENLTRYEEDDNLRMNSPIVAEAIGCFAGMMIKRNIQGAEQFFRKHAAIADWLPPGEDGPEAMRNAHRRYAQFILAAYKYSKADFIRALLRQKTASDAPYIREADVNHLERLDTDKYTEMMKPGETPEEKLKEYRMGFLRGSGGEWVDMLLKKQTLAQWREAHEKQKAAAKAEKKPVDSFESIDLSQTIEAGYVKVIALGAAEAFEKVSRTVLARNAEESPISREILQDIQEAGLNKYDDFQVTVDVEAAIDDIVPTSGRGERKGEGAVMKPTIVKEKTAASVTFRIDGTADILKRHVPEAGPNASVSPTTGDVMIRMQQTGDTWYWASPSGPRVGAVADMVEDEYLIESVRAAMSAYAQISRALIDGDYDLLTIPVVDNGKLIPLEKRKKDKDKMAKALDIEKRILEELMNANLDAYGDHRIEVRWEATLGHGETGAEMGVKPLAVRGYETADVTFMIHNAAEVYRKHAPERSGYDSLDAAGNLRVWMKRINGKWYWNPFGW